MTENYQQTTKATKKVDKQAMVHEKLPEIRVRAVSNLHQT